MLEIVYARLRIFLFTPDTCTMDNPLGDVFIDQLKQLPGTSALFDILHPTPNDSLEALFGRFIQTAEQAASFEAPSLVPLGEGMKALMCVYSRQHQAELSECTLNACSRCGTTGQWSLPRNKFKP